MWKFLDAVPEYDHQKNEILEILNPAIQGSDLLV
jgi:hypothetical protein